MKIKPYDNPPEGEREHVPEHLGSAWWVHESDRGVSHVISLAEVFGIERAGETDQHRIIARNHLRNAIFDTLRDGMPAEAVLVNADCAFDRNAQLAEFSMRKLSRVASFQWPESGSPFGHLLATLIACFRDGKARLAGKRDETDVWWARVIAQLETALAISEARLHG